MACLCGFEANVSLDLSRSDFFLFQKKINVKILNKTSSSRGPVKRQIEETPKPRLRRPFSNTLSFGFFYHLTWHDNMSSTKNATESERSRHRVTATIP